MPYLLLQEPKVRPLNLLGHVGFDSLPDQLVNKSVAQGFCFNILCVGRFLLQVTTLVLIMSDSVYVVHVVLKVFHTFKIYPGMFFYNNSQIL